MVVLKNLTQFTAKRGRVELDNNYPTELRVLVFDEIQFNKNSNP